LRVKKLGGLSLALAVVAVGLFAAPAALARTRGSRHGVPTQIRKPLPQHKFGRGTSTNWSGYAVSGTGATHAIGSWTQPSVTCAAGENSWSSPWVGIDGDTSNTVEQIGTDSDCQSGKAVYYAWYEMYPKSLVTVSIPVRPGDSFTAEVTYKGSSSFLLKLTNNTTGSIFQTTQGSRKARRSSVEWIMEGPSGSGLSNFGSIGFSSASATISGKTGSIGAFAGADPITMVTNGGVDRAVPSGLTGGSAFSVSWKHS
jgi:peptidase A4-like protein